MTSEIHMQYVTALARLLNEIQLQYLTESQLTLYHQSLWSTLMQYDAQFALISNHTGKSASFKVYVNLHGLAKLMVKWMVSHIDYKPCSLEARGLKNCISVLALMTAVQVARSMLSTILHLQTVTFVLINMMNS